MKHTPSFTQHGQHILGEVDLDAAADAQRVAWAREDAAAQDAARDECEGNVSTSCDPNRFKRNFDERTQAGRDARWGD